MKTTIVLLIMVAVVLLDAQGVRGQRERSPVKRRRVLFNCDAAAAFVDAKGSVDTYVQNMFGPFEDSHVDALFWNDGSGGNTASYDSDVLELTGAHMGTLGLNLPPWRDDLLRWIEEGNDPPKIAVQEAHKRRLDVFYSMRLNDIHDAWGPVHFPTFKAQHPEWMIGEGHPYGVETALNFAIPEVRELKLRIIEEIFQKYDFDGMEIDFMRHLPHFIPGTEPENAHILTQFLREVRQHLDQRGQERGRPIELAVRVDENLEACSLDGFQVQTWIKEGLMDILIVGAGAGDVAVEEFKELAADTSVLIYPCLEAYDGVWYRPRSTELRRALALNYWHQGADGIYTFNWYPHRFAVDEETALLKEIGDPNAMRFKPVMFVAEYGPQTLEARPSPWSPHNYLHGVLPAELTEGQVVEVPILVGLDLPAGAGEQPPTRLELRIECEDLAPDDTLAIALNGQGLLWQKREEGSIATHGRPGWIPEPTDFTSVMMALRPEQVEHGRNYVSLRLAQRAPQAQGPVTVTAVEIHLDYQ